MEDEAEEMSRTNKKDSRHDLFGLTLREAQCLIGYAKGLTKEQTADLVGIRPKTVDAHLEQVKRKLGVDCRVKLVVFAIWAGYVEAFDPRTLYPKRELLEWQIDPRTLQKRS